MSSSPDPSSRPNDCAILANLPWAPNAVDPPPAVGCCGWRKDAIYCVLGRVYHLSLVDIPLAGPLSDDFAKLTELNRLRLQNINLQGPLPKNMFDFFSTLDEFWLVENPTTGPLPDGFSRASQLRKVYIGDVPLDGALPDSLRGMSGLRELTIENTNLGGRFPDLDLPQLTHLAIRNNKFTDINLLALTKLKRLTYLGIADHKFSGTLPEEIGQLTELGGLDVSKNAFSGPIPESLTNLIKLRFLHMSDNQFSGTLPAAIGQLSALIEFNLSGNRFSGKIPPSLGDIRTLRELRLSDNRLTGPLPAELANIANLTHLHLHHNQFTGGFPAMYVFVECQVTGANRLACHTPLPADAPKTAYMGSDPACQREIAASKLPVCGSEAAATSGGTSAPPGGVSEGTAVSPLVAGVAGSLATLVLVAVLLGVAWRRRVRARRERLESRAIEVGAPEDKGGHARQAWHKAFGKGSKAPSRVSSAATTGAAQQRGQSVEMVAGPLEPTHRPPPASVLEEGGFVADPEQVMRAFEDEVGGDKQ